MRLAGLATSVLVAGGLAAAVTFAQQPPDRLTALQREADALAKQERTLLTELRQLEVQRDLKTEELGRAEAELARVETQRAEATARIAGLKGRIVTEAPGLSARLVNLYKLGRPGYLRMLFDAERLQDATRAYRTVGALVEADRQRAGEFRQTLDELHKNEKELTERSDRMRALQAQALEARQTAERAVARRAALIAEIDARRDLNAQMMGELQAAHNKLAALTPGGSRPPTQPAASAPALSRLRGSLTWPAPGRVIGRFGAQRDPRFGTTTVRAGIEIGATAGTSAAAIEDGVVAYAEPFAGFGNLVIVDHGLQAYSLYGYLDSVSVARGARVARGQALGSIGHTPAGKPGLYFELRIDGKAVDPVQWLKRQAGPLTQ